MPSTPASSAGPPTAGPPTAGPPTAGPPTAVHPIDRAWISTGGTGAQNYDEFAAESEITSVIAANPHSSLAVEMPHCVPGAEGDFTKALPGATQRLEEAKSSGRYRLVEQATCAYRIIDPATGATAYGAIAMVDTGQISTSADEPGLVIRNEDVFEGKVRERVSLVQATGHLLSSVLLVQTADPQGLQTCLERAIEGAGSPVVVDTDQAGRTHEVWVLGAQAAFEVLAAAGAGELVVADGNHRTLAAQTAGLDRFLAVVTTPRALTLAPYQRLVSDLPMPFAELLDRLRSAGAKVDEAEVDEAGVEEARMVSPGTVALYAAGRSALVRLPAPEGVSGVSRLDHSLVEEVLLGQVLGLAPGDQRVRYIGGDYSDAWLREQVDTGAAELAILIAALGVEEFVEVNLAREQMPRKSTWFVPKARAGLVLAEVGSTRGVRTG